MASRSSFRRWVTMMSLVVPIIAFLCGSTVTLFTIGQTYGADRHRITTVEKDVDELKSFVREQVRMNRSVAESLAALKTMNRERSDGRTRDPLPR